MYLGTILFGTLLMELIYLLIRFSGVQVNQLTQLASS